MAFKLMTRIACYSQGNLLDAAGQNLRFTSLLSQFLWLCFYCAVQLSAVTFILKLTAKLSRASPSIATSGLI